MWIYFIYFINFTFVNRYSVMASYTVRTTILINKNVYIITKIFGTSLYFLNIFLIALIKRLIFVYELIV